MIIRTFVDDIRVIGRSTQGVKLIDLDPEDKLVAMAKLAEREDDASEQAAGEGEDPGEEQGEVEPVN